MKKNQNKRAKSREAMKRNQKPDWVRKREEELRGAGREGPLTYNLGELYCVNETAGFVTHKRLNNIERRG